MATRENKVDVRRLSEDELALIDEMRNGISRAAYLRSLIRKPPETTDVADRTEALAILTGLAREGRTSAAIALERALRGTDSGDDGDLLSKILDESD
jgi:hypothetical protein